MELKTIHLDLFKYIVSPQFNGHHNTNMREKNSEREKHNFRKTKRHTGDGANHQHISIYFWTPNRVTKLFETL